MIFTINGFPAILSVSIWTGILHHLRICLLDSPTKLPIQDKKNSIPFSGSMSILMQTTRIPSLKKY